MKRTVFLLLALLALALAAYRGHEAYSDPSSRVVSVPIAVLTLLLAGYFVYRLTADR